MKRIMLVVLMFLMVSSVAEARRIRRNLYHLVEDRKTVNVYLGEIESVTEMIPAEEVKNVLQETLEARRKERFVVVADKSAADVIVNCEIFFYRYLEDDPVDHIVGGATGLLVDAFVKQNYVQVKAEFEVYRVKDNRRLWRRKFPVSVTETDMPEAESIPKVLKEMDKVFIFYCFGKPKL